MKQQLTFDLKSKRTFMLMEENGTISLTDVITKQSIQLNDTNKDKYSLVNVRKYTKNSFTDVPLKKAVMEDCLAEFGAFILEPYVESFAWIDTTNNRASVKIAGLESRIHFKMEETGEDCVMHLSCDTPIAVLNYFKSILDKQVSIEITA